MSYESEIIAKNGRGYPMTVAEAIGYAQYLTSRRQISERERETEIRDWICLLLIAWLGLDSARKLCLFYDSGRKLSHIVLCY